MTELKHNQKYPPAPHRAITHHLITIQRLYPALEMPALGFSADSLRCVFSRPGLAAKKNQELPFHHL